MTNGGEKKKLKWTVEAGAGKAKLGDHLADNLDALSRMYLRSLVRDGLVEVNGRHENAGYRVRGGDFIEVEADMSRGTSMVAEDIPLEVVFEDNELVVVNKPAGMLVHPSHREKTGTLLNALTYYLNGTRTPLSAVGSQTPRPPVASCSKLADEGVRVPIRPGLVHRLDKDTSGLILVAKTVAAHRILARHFMKKRVEKRYMALVEGVVEVDEGTIEAPIGRHAELKHWSVKDDGKHSETRFWVRGRRLDTTLIELEPVTGRTNQLRIHCELIGHPIVGDVKRGGREFERLCLHAFKLAFPHPSTGMTASFNAPASFGL